MRVPNSIKDLVDPELPSGALAKGVGLWGDERRLTPASGELVRPDQPINAAEKNTPGRSRGRREGKGFVKRRRWRTSLSSTALGRLSPSWTREGRLVPKVLASPSGKGCPLSATRQVEESRITRFSALSAGPLQSLEPLLPGYHDGERESREGSARISGPASHFEAIPP